MAPSYPRGKLVECFKRSTFFSVNGIGMVEEKSSRELGKGRLDILGIQETHMKGCGGQVHEGE